MTEGTMRAVRFHDYGPPEVLALEEAPLPEPGDGQVLVRVAAAGVNPIDWKIRSGMVREYLSLELPSTPGADLSGTVERLGPGVAELATGDAVYGRGNGTYAEFAVADAATLAPAPRSLSAVEAASVPVGASTAWACLFDEAQVKAGQRILVHGAAGGVGIYAVQLARWKGVRVVGTCSTANVDFVRSLGAEEVIDYTTTRFEEVAHDLDAVVDTVGGDLGQRSLAVVRGGGTIVGIAGALPEEDARERGVRTASVNAPFLRERLEMIASLLDSGAVRAVVGAVFPLAEAAEAHRRSERRHGRGRIVLEVGSGF